MSLGGDLALNSNHCALTCPSALTCGDGEREHLYIYTHAHTHRSEKHTVGLSVCLQDRADSGLLRCRRTFRRTGTDFRVRVIVRGVLGRMKKSAASKRVGARFSSSASCMHPSIHPFTYPSTHSSIQPSSHPTTAKRCGAGDQLLFISQVEAEDKRADEGSLQRE